MFTYQVTRQLIEDHRGRLVAEAENHRRWSHPSRRPGRPRRVRTDRIWSSALRLTDC